jgi:glycosyltransferase involved in cell wall biosynthesis
VRTVHAVVPDDVDDPRRPSGGNAYDRRLLRELGGLRWCVREHRARGAWPDAEGLDRARLAETLAEVPSGRTVLVDGLVASSVPEVLAPERDRLRLVVLLHVPLPALRPGDGTAARRERCALAAAAAVVTTSAWTRRHVLRRYGHDPDRVFVAEPGVDLGTPATGSEDGGRLLCVGAVTPEKGHDVLLAALAEVRDLDWSVLCIGPVGRDPGFVARLEQRLHAEGLQDRVSLAGPRAHDEVRAACTVADLLVAPSRVESYGMAVSEALAHGLPVVASAVGGLPDTVGRSGDGRVPGALVPPADPGALAEALRRWLTDPGWRRQLRAAALERGARLTGWQRTGRQVSWVLEHVLDGAVR